MAVHPKLWRFLGFGSSITGFSCFALSSSFQKLFGQWNFLKIILYCTVGFIFSVFVLFVKPILEQFPKVFWWKTRVGYLVLLLTSLYSYYEDQIEEGETKEKKYKRILGLISFGAFAVMSMSVSAQIKPGFEVGVTSFFLGCLIMRLLKINFTIAMCLAISCYAGFVILSYLCSHLQLKGGGGDTLLPVKMPTHFHNEKQGLASDMRNGDQEMNDSVIELASDMRNNDHEMNDNVIETQGLASDMRHGDQEMKDNIIETQGLASDMRNDNQEKNDNVIETQGLVSDMRNDDQEENDNVIETQGLASDMRNDDQEENDNVIETQGLASDMRKEMNDNVIETQGLASDVRKEMNDNVIEMQGLVSDMRNDDQEENDNVIETQGLTSDMRNGDHKMNDNVIDTVLSSHSSLGFHPSYSTLRHRPNKQKIVIEVPLDCQKCRSKVMNIAMAANGVASVSLERNERDRLVIIGEGVDAARLIKSMRKKLKYANLASVAEVEGG